MTHVKNQNVIGASLVNSYMNQKINFVSAKDASAGGAIDKAGIWSVGAVYIDRSKDYKLCQAGQTDSALMWNLNSSDSKRCCVEHKIHRGHLFYYHRVI